MFRCETLRRVTQTYVLSQAVEETKARCTVSHTLILGHGAAAAGLGFGGIVGPAPTRLDAVRQQRRRHLRTCSEAVLKEPGIGNSALIDTTTGEKDKRSRVLEEAVLAGLITTKSEGQAIRHYPTDRTQKWLDGSTEFAGPEAPDG